MLCTVLPTVHRLACGQWQFSSATVLTIHFIVFNSCEVSCGLLQAFLIHHAHFHA